jgi:hypothetical protein
MIILVGSFITLVKSYSVMISFNLWLVWVSKSTLRSPVIIMFSVKFNACSRE